MRSIYDGCTSVNALPKLITPTPPPATIDRPVVLDEEEYKGMTHAELLQCVEEVLETKKNLAIYMRACDCSLQRVFRVLAQQSGKNLQYRKIAQVAVATLQKQKEGLDVSLRSSIEANFQEFVEGVGAERLRELGEQDG
jgi:hypothetical protein